jgi:hypothetical protein
VGFGSYYILYICSTFGTMHGTKCFEAKADCGSKNSAIKPLAHSLDPLKVMHDDKKTFGS